MTRNKVSKKICTLNIYFKTCYTRIINLCIADPFLIILNMPWTLDKIFLFLDILFWVYTFVFDSLCMVHGWWKIFLSICLFSRIFHSNNLILKFSVLPVADYPLLKKGMIGFMELTISYKINQTVHKYQIVYIGPGL